MATVSVLDTEATKNTITTYIKACKQRLTSAKNYVSGITIPEGLEELKGKKSNWILRN